MQSNEFLKKKTGLICHMYQYPSCSGAKSEKEHDELFGFFSHPHKMYLASQLADDMVSNHQCEEKFMKDSPLVKW